MKITHTILRKIIQEEIAKVNEEEQRDSIEDKVNRMLDDLRDMYLDYRENFPEGIDQLVKDIEALHAQYTELAGMDIETQRAIDMGIAE